MKLFLLLIVSFLVVHQSIGQKNHFVYVQSENKQPFYIKISDVLYSSSSAGYAIIPKLTKSDYVFTIGFPKNEWPQVQILVPITEDAGFELKNLPGKGWSLYNMQSMTFLSSSSQPEVVPSANTNTENSFGNILAGVTNTPDLNSVKSEPTAVQKPATVVIAIDTFLPAPPNTSNLEQPAPSNIQKIFSLIDEEGYSLAYVENVSSIPDTIRIFIADPSLKKTIQPLPVIVEPKPDSPQPIAEIPVVAKQIEADPRFLDIDINNTAKVESPTAARENPKPVTPSPKPLMVNSDCKAIAVDDDFLKLRKKMASQKDEEGMVRAGDKSFKSKCYSTCLLYTSPSPRDS